MKFSLYGADLNLWLKPAIQTAGADDMLPSLTWVELRVSSDHVLALSTDRFRASCSRHRFEKPGRHKDIKVHVRSSLLTTALRAVTGGGRRAALEEVEVEVTAERVTFTRGSATFTARTTESEWRESPNDHRFGDPAKFPDIVPLIAASIADHDGPAFQGPMSVNFHFLAEWKSVASRRDATQIVQGPKRTSPYIVRIGDDYLGLLMPRRLLDDHKAPPPIHNGWATALGLHTIPKENTND